MQDVGVQQANLFIVILISLCASFLLHASFCYIIFFFSSICFLFILSDALVSLINHFCFSSLSSEPHLFLVANEMTQALCFTCLMVQYDNQ